MKTVGRVLPRVTAPSRHKSTFIAADAQSVKRVLAELENTNFNPKSDFTSVNEILVGLGSIPLLTGVLRPGAMVMRTRCELMPLYETTRKIRFKSDISYRKDFKNVGIGRVNLAGEPAFYGCIVNYDKAIKNQLAHAAAVCFAETSKDGDGIGQTMVAGVWRVTKPISFSIIVQQKPLSSSNAFVRQSLLPKNTFFRGDKRTSEANQLVSDFFANLYSRPVVEGEEHKYVVGACFATSIFLQGLDAIVYSSVATGGLAPNIAILPEIVDSSLELIHARAMNMQRVGLSSHSERGAYECHPVSRTGFKEDETFNWYPATSRKYL